MYRVAILGAGGIVQSRHLPAWKEQPDAEVSVIVDTRADIAGQVALEHGIARSETDYRTVLNDDTIDIVDLCLPHHLHAEIGLHCMQAGKHLLMEKPIALDLESARELIRTSEAQGKLLMVAENWRYVPVTVEANRLLQAGEIGTPHLLKAAMEFNNKLESGQTNWRLQRQQAGGGVLIDSGIHTMSVARMLFGEIQQVAAFRGRQTWPELAPSEDTLAMIIQFADESVGTLDFTWRGRRQRPQWSFEVLGSEATLIFDVYSGAMAIERDGEREDRPQPSSYGFMEEIRHFLDCLQSGRHTPTTGYEEARTLAAVIAAYRSAESRRAESVEEI